MTDLLATVKAALADGTFLSRDIEDIVGDVDALVAEVERLREVESDFASFQEHHAATERDLAAARAEAALLRKFYEAWQRCDSNRGCYSCCEPHDCRCPFDRSNGEKPCACGRAELDAAEAALEER